jgi:hypothetical protein
MSVCGYLPVEVMQGIAMGGLDLSKRSAIVFVPTSIEKSPSIRAFQSMFLLQKPYSQIRLVLINLQTER